MPLIEIKNLEKTYNEGETETRALCGVSFDVKEGEFVAVMGPSGSGKSTLLHILGFLDRQTKGNYLFDGKELNEYTDNEAAKVRNEKMGFVFQSFNLLPRTSVLENVKLPLLYSSTPQSKWASMAKKAIEQVGLSHRLNHLTSQLSGGERQRVAIARALINEPKIIFADEPTGNLDSKSGSAVMEIVEKLNDQGHTIILITHETYTAQYAQRIITLMDGEIENDRKVEKRRKGKDEFVK
ncbi:MAG: ABC transporter ATP-binding protein [Candidatus Pacebacteria bacterium]|nr:ABC transporter ATP-binding protein [Candidatus Paceibacterota bacterium]